MQPQHARLTQPDQDEDDIDPLVNQQGCGKVYAKLEECLGENDRDWRRCQREVSDLKECYQKATRLQEKLQHQS